VIACQTTHMTIAAPGNARIRGFTLIEVVLVVAIVAVFAAMAMPRFAASNDRYRVDLAARKLIADIQYIRSVARARGTITTLTFDAAGTSYSLGGVTDAGTPVSAQTIRLDEPPFSCKATTTLKLAAGTSTSVVSFNAFGIPDATGDVTFMVGGGARTVSLLPGGLAVLK
jgi:prepilin-type N-terminal cleavage/methylation domain-containing protein